MIEEIVGLLDASKCLTGKEIASHLNIKHMNPQEYIDTTLSAAWNRSTFQKSYNKQGEIVWSLVEVCQ